MAANLNLPRFPKMESTNQRNPKPAQRFSRCEVRWRHSYVTEAPSDSGTFTEGKRRGGILFYFVLGCVWRFSFYIGSCPHFHENSFSLQCPRCRRWAGGGHIDKRGTSWESWQLIRSLSIDGARVAAVLVVFQKNANEWHPHVWEIEAFSE